MEADGQVDTEAHERTEGAATAIQAMHGDSCCANRVDPGSNTTSTSFGVKADPPALPCRDDALVDNSAAAPKSCLPSLEMRSPTAAGGLLPAGEASIATTTTYNSQLFGSTRLRNEFKEDTSEDSDSIRLVQQQFLVKE